MAQRSGKTRCRGGNAITRGITSPRPPTNGRWHLIMDTMHVQEAPSPLVAVKWSELMRVFVAGCVVELSAQRSEKSRQWSSGYISMQLPPKASNCVFRNLREPFITLAWPRQRQRYGPVLSNDGGSMHSFPELSTSIKKGDHQCLVDQQRSQRQV